MSNVWERFDTIVTAEEVSEERAKYAPIMPGTYDMVLEKIEAGETQQGLPAVKGRFRTTENKVVFYNQTLQNINNPDMTATNIAKAVDFISGLLDEEIQFTTLGALAGIIDGIPTGTTHRIKVSYGKKDIDMKYPILTVA